MHMHARTATAVLSAPLTVDLKPWLVQNALFLLSLLAPKLILRELLISKR